MIPRRVLHPTIKPSSNNEKRLKGEQTDWDSPSSYTGTVKRRPQSFESSKFLTPINDNDNIVPSKCNNAHPHNIELPPDIAHISRHTNNIDKSTGKTSNPKSSNKDFHINTRCNNSKSSPISTTLKRRTKLKLPTTNASNQLKSSSSECLNTKTTSTVNTPGSTKLSTVEPKINGKHSAIPNPLVEKLKENATRPVTTLSHNQHDIVLSKSVSIGTLKIPNKQHSEYKRHFVVQRKLNGKSCSSVRVQPLQTPPTAFTKPPPQTFSQLYTTNTQNKHALKTLQLENKSSFEKPASITYTELYRDFPVNYASTTIVENIPLKPPPYCNPPSVPPKAPSSQVVLFKQNKNLIETQKKIRLEKENESTQNGIHKHHQQPKHTKNQFSDGICDGDGCFNIDENNIDTYGRVCGEGINSCNKLPNEFRLSSLKGNLPKTQNISKIECRNNRFFSTTTPNNKPTEKTAYDKKCIFSGNNGTRVKSNVYVLFNPINSNSNNSTNMAKAISPDGSTACDILARPKFTSNVFANIPIRPRKGIPHLENYCLFDPSKDFVNEKELRKQPSSDEPNISAATGRPQDSCDLDDDELVEEIIYEDQLAFGNDENEAITYFPKIDEAECEASTSSGSQVDSMDSDLMMSSVIETSSPNMESTDDNETNNKPKPLQTKITKSISGSLTINEQKASATGASNSSTIFGGTLKKHARIDKLIRYSSLPSDSSIKRVGHEPSTVCDDSSTLNDFSQNVENENEVNFSPSLSIKDVPLKQQQKDTLLKQSVSSPQLQQISFIIANGNKNVPSSLMESNYVLFHPAPVHSRIPYRIRQPRPLSTHSDADSGFLSPVVTPDGPADGKFNPALLVLQQCDSIQGYIEVSFVFSYSFCIYKILHTCINTLYIYLFFKLVQVRAQLN